MKKFSYVLIVLLAVSSQIFGQGQDMEEDLFDLTLEELMNIEIVSASKKAESSFKSPLSSTVLTKDEIVASGATTIEEALRLVPGMLVREESNGNFDVHIRGNDNIAPGNYLFYTENTMSLVMIDGRPVYNYINGGTFWESLPISIVDVERIEVVRGPATALYGPNAVTGAVNIITRKPDDKNISASGSVQIGNKSTQIYDLSVGTSLADDKLKIRLSGNLEERDRDMTDYYSFYLGDYVPGDQVVDYSTMTTSDTRYPKPELAKDKKGLNAYIGYDVTDKVALQLSAGTQESQAQSVFMEQTSAPLNIRSNNSQYVNFYAQAYNLSVQYSLNTGVTNILAGTNDNASYDYDNNFVNVEYDLNIGKLTLRPGINYQSAIYSDIAYGGGEDNGFLNGEETLNNFGYFLRADYKITEKLRAIAAIRNDVYNVPDDSYLTYQFISTYNFSDNQMVRALYSKANRGPFMLDSYSNYDFGNGISEPYVQYQGSENLPLPTMDMFEVGYRGMLSKKVTLDVEVFHTATKDITSFEPTFFGLDKYGIHLLYEYEKLDLKVKQTGMTIGLNYAPSNKVQLRAYTTMQQTELENYDKKVTPVYFDPETFGFYLPQKERMNTTHKQTPSFYGGFTGNFRPMDKLNIFAGIYYQAKHTYRHDYAAADESKGQTEIPGSAIFNLKVSYNVYKNNSVFFNTRNAFSSGTQQFGFSDDIAGLYLFGLNLSF